MHCTALLLLSFYRRCKKSVCLMLHGKQIHAAVMMALATPFCTANRSFHTAGAKQARFLAIHAAPSSLVLLINAPKSVQSRMELRHRAEVPWAY